MPQFRFEAYDKEGDLQRGEVFAASTAEALDMLAGRQLVPFAVDEAAANSSVPWWAQEVSLSGDVVPKEALADFLESLALLLRAKLPVLTALRTAMEDVKDRRLRDLLEDAERSLSGGGRLSDPLSTNADVVPKRISVLITLGEDANRLSDTTTYASDLLRRELAFRSELKGALTYPAILLGASLLVIAGLIFFLAPTLEPVFASVGAEPPWIIAAMVWLREMLVGNAVLIGIGVLFGALALLLLIRQRHPLVQRLWLSLPLLGAITRLSEALSGLMTLSLMLKSGAPLLTGLEAAREACRLDAYRYLFDDLADRVRTGGKMSETLSNHDLLPSPIARMIRLGEEVNQLPDMLENAVTLLDGQIRQKTQSGLRLVTPIMTLVIGVIVGALIFTTLSAILEINELAL
ncbi:MAG: type II secretion system F family protein [Pseudomonadota bacterium]